MGKVESGNTLVGDIVWMDVELCPDNIDKSDRTVLVGNMNAKRGQ